MNIIHLLCNEKLGNFKVFFSAGQIESAYVRTLYRNVRTLRVHYRRDESCDVGS